MTENTGTLPAQTIEQLINAGHIKGAGIEHVSPASLDLTLSGEIYEISGLILPQRHEKVTDLIKLMGAKPVSISEPVQPGQLYLARLNEALSLPPQIYGYCNPKSSTGRLDTHVRVLADGVSRYDSLTPEGFTGALWVAITPKSFSIKLHEGTPLTQLRLFNADAHFTETDLKQALAEGLMWHPTEDKLVPYENIITSDRDGSIILTALLETGVCGYECIATRDQVIDVANVAGYDSTDFFRPLSITDGTLRLERDKFYILSGAERIKIPPTVASEMVPMDERSGDFRSHYAGFLDPGWGYGADGTGKGRPFTLEVRPFEDLIIRPGQPIAKIRFERMAEEPIFHYDSDPKSHNYRTQQGPKLGKQFR